MAATQPTWGNWYLVPSNMTGNDLLRLPDDGNKNELYEGVLVREEMTSIGHGFVCQRLGGELYAYAKATGFSLPITQNALFDFTPASSTQKTILAPDIAITRTAGPFAWDAILTVPPLLAIEVVSPSQTLAELGMKAQFYRNNGVDEVWVIDHATRVVEIWNAQGIATLTDGQTVTSALLPGFALAVTYLLDG